MAEIKLKPEERQPCEVWTRVMGYHRPISEFNPGKKSEHAERRHFKEPASTLISPEVGDRARQAVQEFKPARPRFR